MACTAGCMSVCTGTCKGSCDGCDSGCASRCDGGCKFSCSNGCSNGCSSCSGTCISGCYTGCYGDCKADCAEYCGSAAPCASGCEDSWCRDKCTGTCKGTCTGCSGSCSGNCSGTCQKSCGNNCTGTCDYGCANSTYADNYNLLNNGLLSDIIYQNEIQALLNLSYDSYTHHHKTVPSSGYKTITKFTTKTLNEIFNQVKTNLINSGAYTEDNFKTQTFLSTDKVVPNQTSIEFAKGNGINSDGIANDNEIIRKKDIWYLIQKVLIDYSREKVGNN